MSPDWSALAAGSEEGLVRQGLSEEDNAVLDNGLSFMATNDLRGRAGKDSGFPSSAFGGV